MSKVNVACTHKKTDTPIGIPVKEKLSIHLCTPITSEGRKAGTKDLMGITHKPPIVIDPGNYMFFFPTTSSSRRQCAWISHAHILQYAAADFDNTEIFFTNGSSETISVSSTSFENQLYRTAQLRTIITARIEEEHRKMNLLLFPKEKQTNLIYEQIIRELNKH
ncbi:competence protein ComK [Metabacillus dongyingensis]|uniref:competence protein ComK n=1 Tax=Metabacillus dongyingensis TaxID=2874282 RepID=UPI003B8ACDFA